VEFVISPLGVSFAFVPFLDTTPLGAKSFVVFAVRISGLFRFRISDFGFSLPSALFVLKSLRVP
jgi:hypothetical protein